MPDNTLTMYKPFEESLKSLWQQFRRCSLKYGPLRYERILPPLSATATYLDAEVWQAFVDANRAGDGQWEEWLIAEDGRDCGRFFGEPDGFQEYRELAESLYLVLREIEPDLPRRNGVLGVTRLLCEVAFGYPTPLLRLTDTNQTAQDDEVTLENLQQAARAMEEEDDMWSPEGEGTPSYPLHPIRQMLQHDLFVSTMAFIKNTADREGMLLVGDYSDDIPVRADTDGDEGDEDDEQTGTDEMEDADESAIAVQSEAPDVQPKYVFKKVGAKWFVRFPDYDGTAVECELSGTLLGAGMYHQSFQRGEKPIDGFDLAGVDRTQFREDLSEHDLWDKETYALVRKALRKLRERKADAESQGDDDEANRLADEIKKNEALLEEANAHRAFQPPSREQVRKMTYNRLDRVRANLRKRGLDALADHLERYAPWQEFSLRYCPSEPIPWELF